MDVTFGCMKSASLAEIKKELKTRHADEVFELCARMAKYKKDNKELLNYLLFESENESEYVESIKNDITEAFDAINTSGFYLAKKTVRRALRIANKYAKYSDVAETELELLVHFCREMKGVEIDFTRSKVMMNLYCRQLERIDKIYRTLHEDLRFDFEADIQELRSYN